MKIKVFSQYLKSTKPKYILWFVMAIIYITLLATIGWGNSILSKLELIKYMLLSPMMISALMIDWKLQIIPNRLNLTMFEAVSYTHLDVYKRQDLYYTCNYKKCRKIP